MRVLVLPGMDGRGRLLGPFLGALPPPLQGEVVEYPPDRAVGYRGLERLVASHLSDGTPTVLVAESFSGPVGIRVAARAPAALRALVLVATFAHAPAPRWLERAVGRHLFWIRPPDAFVRAAMLDRTASLSLVRGARGALAASPPRVMAQRLRQILRVDVRGELARVRVPILCVEGTRDRLLLERRALARCRPDARWVAIDAPHFVLQRRPDESARAIARFVAELG